MPSVGSGLRVVTQEHWVVILAPDLAQRWVGSGLGLGPAGSCGRLHRSWSDDSGMPKPSIIKSPCPCSLVISWGLRKEISGIGGQSTSKNRTR